MSTGHPLGKSPGGWVGLGIGLWQHAPKELRVCICYIQETVTQMYTADVNLEQMILRKSGKSIVKLPVVPLPAFADRRKHSLLATTTS